MKAKLIKKDNQYYCLDENTVIVGTTDDSLLESQSVSTKKLCLDNCQAIERNFDLVDHAIAYAGSGDPQGFSDKQIGLLHGYIDGFEKALELMGDKKFSVDDVRNIFAKTLENAPSTESHTRMISDVEYRHFVMDELYDRITKSLQTEWDVEIEMQRVKDGTKIIGAVKGVKGSGSKITTYKSIPKLDADECLILKRKDEKI